MQSDIGAPLYTAGAKHLVGLGTALPIFSGSNACGILAGFTSAVYYRGWIDCVLDPNQDPEMCDPLATTTTTRRPTTTTTRSSGASPNIAPALALWMIISILAL